MSEENDIKMAKLEQRLLNIERDCEVERERNAESHQRIYSRLEPLEKENVVVAVQYNQIMQILSELKEDVKSLKDRPSKRFDLLITAIISMLVSGIGMYLLNTILRNGV